MVGIRLLILIGCLCHLAECAKRDIVFVLDRSSSLSADDVNDAIEFIFNVSSFLTIGDQDVQISIVTFSDNVRTEFNFSKHTTKEDLLVAITALKGMSTAGGTHTYTALEHVQNDIFVSAAGARADAEKVVVVMTDGASVDLLKTVSAANELRDDLDATLFSVAIGKDPDRDEINGIANDPDSYYVASASDFIYLCNVVPALVPKLDSSASATISADCPVDVQYTTETTSVAVTSTDSDVEQQSQESTSSSTFIWIIAGLLFLLLLVLLTCCGVLYLQKKKREKNKEKSKVPYQEIEMLSSPIVSTQRKPVFRDPSTLSSNCWTSSSDKNEELVASSLHNLARESTKSMNSLLYKDMLNFRPSSRQNHWV